MHNNSLTIAIDQNEIANIQLKVHHRQETNLRIVQSVVEKP